jgi:DNA-binding PadR family transcriptional regulator
MPGVKGLEAVLLAGLWVAPRSGYDLTQWFGRAARHYWATHHSSIYPTLKGLQKSGLIEHEPVASQRGPQRKVYRLTPGGTRALETWLLHPPAPPEVRDEQLVKVLALDLLPREAAVALLSSARARAQEQRDHYAKLLAMLEAEIAAHTERRWLGQKLTLMRAVRVQDAYVHWCDDALRLLQTL